MTIAEGARLPDVALTLMDGSRASLASFTGKPLVIYFYPKDDTPGCTREAQDFTALADEFAAAGVALLGVSKDTPAKHAKFTSKYGLKVPLASDDDANTVLEAFGAWVEKSMYGKKYMGIERSTFLFAADGTLARAWRNVKVPGHAAEVLAAAKSLA
jgi:thioredoxin-dependent peroxiredoxin